MLRKFFALLLCLSLVFSLGACAAEPATPPAEDENSVPSDNITEVAPKPEDLLEFNPLTGLKDFNPEKKTARPVAIMIDNDSVAQKNAQIGVQTADVVFETEVEGGITRLMVLFADVTKASQIGDVRSARAAFVDIATGFNAIYCHHGMDVVYCANRMKELGTDNYVIDASNCGWRHTYGSSTNWQNLYTTGEKLWNSLTASKWKTTQKSFDSWQTFTEDPLTLTGGAATRATVAFNTSSTSYFDYDASTGKYIKTSRLATNKDNLTGEAYAFKNVFVLKTTMGYYSSDPHRKIDLNSGTGYYVVNGTYEKINWKKGAASNNFTFTKADGSPLTVQAGSSWVCIVKNEAEITFN